MPSTKTIVKDFTKAIYASDFKDSLPSSEEFYVFMNEFIEDHVDSPKKLELSPEIKLLKEEYLEKVGKKAGGPKANDPSWLQSKITESESSESESETELSKVKEEYLEKVGKKAGGPKANDMDWLQSKIKESEAPETELFKLKKAYKDKLGKKASGPKANDIEWLQSKIDSFESRSSEEVELAELKSKYEDFFGKRPRGPKANSADWIKSKLQITLEKEEADDSESEEEEKVEEEEKQVESKDDDEEKADEDGDGLHNANDFLYEGVEYFMMESLGVNSWKIEDDDGNQIGNLIMDEESNPLMNWSESCWEDIHQDHDDYNGGE